jgi:steroid delta-isomerase-like uncharacterized protein
MADNKAALQRFYDEVVNAGRLELIDELLTEDFVEHEEFPDIPPTREGVRQFFGLMRGAFPDLRMEAEHVLAEGDLVAAHIHITGTHQGEFMGVPASGRRIDLRAIDLLRFRDGRASEHWGVTDVMLLMTQIGAIPPPA